MRISTESRDFLNALRGVSILRVVLGHLGLFWIFPPYSEFFHALLPLLFFVSGAVSFGSFCRSTSISDYLYRRVVGVTAPYYVIAIISVFTSWAFSIQSPALTPESLGRIIGLAPTSGDLFFPIGQVWFIHALVIIVVFSVPFFSLARKSTLWLLPPIALSLVFGIVQLNSNVASQMFILGHNLYQPLVNAGFFFLGAFYISNQDSIIWRRINITIGTVGFLTAAGLISLIDIPIGLSKHSYSPNIYYLSCAFFSIALIITLRAQIMGILDKLKLVKRFLDHTSTHAYSIFLSHSFFIYAAERWLGLVSVRDSGLDAILKVSVVIGACYFSGPLLTRLTKLFTKLLLKLNPISKQGRIAAIDS